MPAVAAAVLCCVLDVGVNRSVLNIGESKAVDENSKRTFSLRKASDFVLLIKHAKIFKGEDFLIRYLDNQQGHARLGIAVSKKRIKQAVRRNRIKRIIRETFRIYCLRLPAKDYMISYRGMHNRKDFPKLYKRLIDFWEQEAIYDSK